MLSLHMLCKVFQSIKQVYKSLAVSIFRAGHIELVLD